MPVLFASTPEIGELVECLRSIHSGCDTDPCDLEDECELEACACADSGDYVRFIDVRLQRYAGSYRLWSGDSSYDTDHRGDWTCSTVSASDDTEQLVAVANALLDFDTEEEE